MAFYAPQNTPQGFCIPKNYVFVRKIQKVRLFAPQNTPQGVSRGKSSVSRRRNPSLAHARQSTGSSGSTGLVSSSAAQTLPSTRAGGQDDGSYNKLPQKNMWKQFERTSHVFVCFIHTKHILMFFLCRSTKKQTRTLCILFYSLTRLA